MVYGGLRPVRSIRLTSGGRLYLVRTAFLRGEGSQNPKGRLLRNGADFSTASGRVCAIQSLMQQALLGPKHPPFRADRTNRLAPAGIPIIPTHVLDRSLTDANHVTDMVCCRKALNQRGAGSAER